MYGERVDILGGRFIYHDKGDLGVEWLIWDRNSKVFEID